MFFKPKTPENSPTFKERNPIKCIGVMPKRFIWKCRRTGELQRVRICEVGVEEEGLIRKAWDYIIEFAVSDEDFPTKELAIEAAIKNLEK